MNKIEESKNDLFVRMKATRSIDSKANGTSTDNFSMVAIDVIQTENSNERSIELSIHLQSKKVKTQN